MTGPLASIALREEQDVVLARQQARQVAKLLGFDPIGQARLATSVSEIARNAFMYAGGGRVTFEVEAATAPQLLTIRVTDFGRGIADLPGVLAGRDSSTAGPGLGIVGTRRMMDVFDVQTSPTGSTVTMKKILPSAAPVATPSALARMTTELAAVRAVGPFAAIHEQNQELLRALDDLRQRQEDLERVNRELDDTNRGVVALYAELDERADQLRRVDEVKTRFLSNMTHEFRTPVNSILALTALLAERLEIDPEDKNEVHFIRRSAMQLAEMVDDLLDIAKVEAGKVDVHLAIFEVRDLFGALRGMLRPLLVNDAVALEFDECDGLPPVCSDEGKVSQILRNFISNALKYTERGHVRVSARLAADGARVEFTIADTGIGIPERDLARIFDEFVQIENPIQRRVKGTGLGLPLSKRLAELIGGDIDVRSVLGEGSTFVLTLPLMPADPTSCLSPDQTRWPVLVVDDDEHDLTSYRNALAGTRFYVVPVRSAAGASRVIEAQRPAAIVLDPRPRGDISWGLVPHLKQHPLTARVPIVVVSAQDDEHKATAFGADAYGPKPLDAAWLRGRLEALVPQEAPARVLVIDDQDAARFIVREILSGAGYEIFEASTGADGLRQAKRLRPACIVLDLHLGDMDGLEVRDALQRDPQTAQIPVIVMTSRHTSSEAQARLEATAVLSKAEITRERLRAAVDRALDRSAAPSEGERTS